MSRTSFENWKDLQAEPLEALLREARELSWEMHGKRLTCYVPGKMQYMDQKGLYPVLSITGASCHLQCDHCRGKILEEMLPLRNGAHLVEVCKDLEREGNLGVLVSGGSDMTGRLPWKEFAGGLAQVKEETNLKVSVHCGLVDHLEAQALKEAGVDEVMLDVIGCQETFEQVYHLPDGLKSMQQTLTAIAGAGLTLVPHLVVGLHFGRILGEVDAIKLLRKFALSTLVIVVLRPLPGTPMAQATPPEPEEIARITAAARISHAAVPLSFSCTRPFGPHRRKTDVLAIEAGVNRMAMPSDAALARAKELGLQVSFRYTCCSSA